MSRRDGTSRREWTSGHRERSSLTTRLLAQTEMKLLWKYVILCLVKRVIAQCNFKYTVQNESGSGFHRENNKRVPLISEEDRGD